MKKILIFIFVCFNVVFSEGLYQDRVEIVDSSIVKIADSSIVEIVDSSIVEIVDSTVVIVADSVRIKDTLKTYIVDNNNILNLDDATGAVTGITYEHHEIHSGSHLYICDSITLASGADMDFQLTTSNTAKWIHMTFQLEGTQQTTIQIFETADVDADGVSLTPRNNNRNFPDTTSLTLLQIEGTVNTAGTMIYSQTVGVAGNANKAKQGLASRDREIILRQNTTYRFLFTSGGNGNVIAFCGEWYEHTDKN